MFNYSSLNDVEFEELCRDILNQKYDLKLRTFAKGRDKGIDLADSLERMNTLAQVKHYANSTVSNLMTALNKEIHNVENLKPKTYYICTSLSLSAEKIKEIYELFSDYMPSEENILAKQDIDSFLQDPENKNIVVKNFKLWIDNSGILQEITNNQIFVDCEALMSNINKEKNLFVKTSIYDDAVKSLKENRLLMIIGNPGVGKTMLTKMLALKFAVDGYKIRYTTNVTNLTELKSSLSRNSKDKEIVLIDDCFGQAYFEMKESQSNELMSLIDYVNLSSNKILVLNSRVTIYQEAKNRSIALKQSEEDEKYRLHVIDVNKMNELDKAKILYNHIYFYEMPQEYFEEIKKEKRYLSIIRHHNYNPRIVEFVCKKHFYQNVKVSDYYNKIMENLDNPEQIWENEYEIRLQKVDRILLTTIYSFSDKAVPLDWVLEAFNIRLKKEKDIDITQDQFKKSCKRLLEGFIINTELNDRKALSMINPSVNDFLDKRMYNNKLEKEDLLENALSIIQKKRLMSQKDYEQFVIHAMQDHSILNYLIFVDKDRFIVSNIIKYKIFDKHYIPNIINCIHNYVSKSENKSKDNLITNKIEELYEDLELIRYYNLVEVYEREKEKVKEILAKSDIDAVIKGIKNLYSCMTPRQQKNNVEDFVDVINQAIENYCEEIDAAEILSDEMPNLIKEHTIYEEYGIDIDEVEIEEDARKIINNELYNQIFDMCDSLPEEIKVDLYYEDLSEYVLNIEDYINDYIKSDPDPDDYLDDYRDYLDAEDRVDLIDSIFNKR